MIRAMYFSATGTTERTVKHLCECLAFGAGKAGEKTEEIEYYDFTSPDKRRALEAYFEQVCEKSTEQDVLVVGLPVYAGRLPNLLMKTLNRLPKTEKRVLAVPLVLFGNRNYDAALNELMLLLIEKGCTILSGGAFVGEHSFSKILAKGRPDHTDLEELARWATGINRERVLLMKTPMLDAEQSGMTRACVVQNELLTRAGGAKTRESLPAYFRPRDKEGNFMDFKPIKPMTTNACINCGICVSVCPMGAVSDENYKEVTGTCIKCCACVKKCPVQAKVFTDENFIYHRKDLEQTYVQRAKVQILLYK